MASKTVGRRAKACAPVDPEVAELRRQLRLERIDKEKAAIEASASATRRALGEFLWERLLAAELSHARENVAAHPAIAHGRAGFRAVIDAAYSAAMRAVETRLSAFDATRLAALQEERAGLTDSGAVRIGADARALLSRLRAGADGAD